MLRHTGTEKSDQGSELSFGPKIICNSQEHKAPHPKDEEAAQVCHSAKCHDSPLVIATAGVMKKVVRLWSAHVDDGAPCLRGGRERILGRRYEQ